MAAIEILVRATALLTAAWIAASVLRRASASLRAGLWTAALAGVLLLPLVWYALPAWRVEVFRPVAAKAPSSVPLEVPLPLLRPQDGVAFATAAEPAPARSAIALPGALPAASSAPVLPWTSLLSGLWAIGTVLLLTQIVTSHVRLARVSRRASSPGEELTLPAMPLRESALPVRLTDEVTVPAVAGLIRPVLLLPLDAGEWSPVVTKAVFRHELAHIRRRDPLGHLVGRLACALYWFVPLVWLGARRAAELREQACDDEVLRSGVAASAYASSLIHLAQHAGCAPFEPAALAMAAPTTIQERVMTILNPSVSRATVGVRASLVLGLAVAAAVTLAAAVVPVPRSLTIANGAPAPATPPRPAMGAEEILPGAVPPAPHALPPSPRPPQTAAPSRICGDHLDHNSTSISDNNGRRTLTISLRGSRCTVDARLEGRVEFNDDFTDIATMSSDGFLRLDVTDAGVRRQLDVKSDGRTLTRTWRVDGRESPYDAAARAWFAEFLVELDRWTAIGVSQRLPRLLRQGGVNAVLAETGQMRSDYARGVYYTKLAAATRLSNADVARILDQAASLKTEDYYASELIKNLGAPIGDDAAVRAGMFKLLQGMTSDYYRTEGARGAIGRGRLSARELDFLMDMVPRITSDYYKTQLLGQIVGAGSLDASQRTQLAKLARDIHEDYYASEFITTLATSGDMGREGSRALVEAAGVIRADHYRATALAVILKDTKLEEADLLSMVKVAIGTGSDHYRAEILRGILRHRGVTDRVRTAVVDAAAGMSSFYRDEVKRAAGIKSSDGPSA